MTTIICNTVKIELIPVNDKPTCTECPSCGNEVQRIGPMWVCVNTNCHGVQLRRIKKWIEKRNIMFLGDSNLKKLWEADVVTKISDLYCLTSEIMKYANFSQRMADKILEQIEKSKNCSLAEFMGALSIDMLGRSEAKNLVKHGIDTLSKWGNLTEGNIRNFPGYQATKARRISRSVRDNWSMIEKIAHHLVFTAATIKVVKDGKLNGVSFCFTGTMDKPRKELEAMATNVGGEVRSVSSGLDYLVIADPSSTSSKAKKARKLGVSLISEVDFLQMV